MKPACGRRLAYTDAMRANCKAFAMVALLAAIAAAGAPVAAQTVYKSVENGVPTFSDAPPTGDTPVETIVLEVPAPADDPQLTERLEQMREATDRMAADRREREAHRATLREQQAVPVPEPAAEPGTVIVAGRSYWPTSPSYLPPFRPPYRPPHVRPPMRPQPLPAPVAPPGWSVMRGGNSQLMRPIVSSRP
jgi:hypothetical protein